jgi:hypothetical protein
MTELKCRFQRVIIKYEYGSQSTVTAHSFTRININTT